MPPPLYECLPTAPGAPFPMASVSIYFLFILEQKERDDDTSFEEQLETMDELHRAGKVRSDGERGRGAFSPQSVVRKFCECFVLHGTAFRAYSAMTCVSLFFAQPRMYVYTNDDGM